MAEAVGNSSCILCNNPTFDNQLNQHLSCKFIRIFTRYVEAEPVSGNKEQILSELKFCEGCVEFGNSFCELYFQIKKIQVQLNLKVETIYETLNHAEAVLSVKEDHIETRPLTMRQQLRLSLIVHCKSKLISDKHKPSVSTEKLFCTQQLEPVVKTEVKKEPENTNIKNDPQLTKKVLKKIFEKLDRHDRSSQLAVRQVSRLWKTTMDSLLEQRRLETWTEWEPSILDSSANNCFPRLYPVSANTNTTLDWVLCLDSIWDGSHIGNPFPGNSLFVNPGSGQLIKEHWRLTRVSDFFSKGVSPLTSLTLEDVQLHVDLIPKMLSKTPNLKTFSLSDITLRSVEPYIWDEIFEEHHLPTLPSLTHIKLLKLHVRGRLMDGDNVYQWVLEPYVKQLVGLETDMGFDDYEHEPCMINPRALPQRWRPKKEIVVYKNLKQAKFHHVDQPFFTLTDKFPALERLSMLSFNGPVHLSGLGNFLTNFAGTLNQLYLDFKGTDSSWRRNWKLEFYEGRNGRNADDSQALEAKDVPLLHLKRFTVFFPRTEREIEVIKMQLLPRFPNLEKLELLHYQDKFTRNDYNEMGKLLSDKFFLEICSKLRTITVLKHKTERDERIRRILCSSYKQQLKMPQWTSKRKAEALLNSRLLSKIKMSCE